MFTGNVEIVADGVALPTTNNGVQYLQVDTMTTEVVVGKGDLSINPTKMTITGEIISTFCR